MMQGNMIATKLDEGILTTILEQGRKRGRLFMSLNLNLSYFDINIDIRKNDKKKVEKTEKNYHHEKRITKVLEERNSLQNQIIMNMMFR